MKEITISAYNDKDSNNEMIATLNFGKVEAHVYENTGYLLDDLYDGYCYLSIPDGVYDIFERHNAQKVTQKLNPKLISVLQKLFTSYGRRLEDRASITVDVSNDKNIQELFADEEFQKLNAESKKSNDQNVISPN